MTYHPNRSMKIMFPLCIVDMVSMLMLLGAALFEALSGAVLTELLAVLLAGSAAGMWLVKYVYDSIRAAVVFEENGFCVVDYGAAGFHRYDWQELECVCYISNSKGQQFAVLSEKEFSSQEIKQRKGKWLRSFKMCQEDVVIIHMNSFQKDTARVKEIIESKVTRIKEYPGENMLEW